MHMRLSDPRPNGSIVCFGLRFIQTVYTYNFCENLSHLRENSYTTYMVHTLYNHCSCNYIFSSLSCLGEGAFRSSSQVATCLPLKPEVSLGPFSCWTSSMKAVNTNFSSLWFDLTWNRTQGLPFQWGRYPLDR